MSESEKIVRQDSQEVKSGVAAVTDPQIAHSVKATSHRYVLLELRQIGIIAGFLIVILIILTFVLG